MGRQFRFHLYDEKKSETMKKHREFLKTNSSKEESDSPYYQQVLSYYSMIKEDISFSRRNENIISGKYTIKDINCKIRDLLDQWEETRDIDIYEAVRAYCLLGWELADEPEGKKISLHYD